MHDPEREDPTAGPPLSVWAPAATSVDAVLVARGATGFSDDDVRVPLARDERTGWWSASDARADDGDLYGFSVDGGPARPDPRSARQPSGVHGPSAVVDTSRFVWTDAAWAGRAVGGSVVYELHVGTFTPGGTLDDAVERLGHLRDLGVDLVELMPVAAFDGVHGWGYDGVHLYAVHEPYGGPAALARFVDAAHAHGIGVVLDVVYNHLGPSGNYTATFGPYFTDHHTTPWGSGIDVDGPQAREVRRWVIDNALRWLRDFHVDALRLDAVHALVDTSARHLLAELSDEVAALARTLGRPLGLVAESDENDPRTVEPTTARSGATTDASGPGSRATASGRGMTAQWADDVHHAVHALLTGERHGYYVDFGSPEVLRTALTSAFVHTGGWSTFRGVPWGHPVPECIDGHRFVAFSCDHDQVGNRALGDRPHRPVDGPADHDRQAAAAALVLTSAFTPMLFMGEEWGASTPWQFFTDFTDPDLARAVSEGRRSEFGGHDWEAVYGAEVTVPDPQDPATVAASTLRWDETGAPGHRDLLAWHQRLVALRRSEPDLASADRSRVAVTWVEADDGDGPADARRNRGATRVDSLVLTVDRGDVRVLLNLTRSAQRVTVPSAVDTSAGHTAASAPGVAAVAPELLAAWGDVTPEDADGASVRVTLPAGAVAVLARAGRRRL